MIIFGTPAQGRTGISRLSGATGYRPAVLPLNYGSIKKAGITPRLYCRLRTGQDFVKCSRSIVHPRHHSADIEHLALLAIEFRHEELIMLHHLVLERFMYMAVKMIPSVKMWPLV